MDAQIHGANKEVMRIVGGTQAARASQRQPLSLGIGGIRSSARTTFLQRRSQRLGHEGQAASSRRSRVMQTSFTILRTPAKNPRDKASAQPGFCASGQKPQLAVRAAIALLPQVPRKAASRKLCLAGLLGFARVMGRHGTGSLAHLGSVSLSSMANRSSSIRCSTMAACRATATRQRGGTAQGQGLTGGEGEGLTARGTPRNKCDTAPGGSP